MLRRLKSVALAALLMTAAALPSPARSDAESKLAAARARFADLDFEGALSAFTSLATSATDPHTRATALTGKGLCQQILGKPKEARASFLESLAIDPEQKLPADTSPKLARPFRAARAAFQKDYAPKLSLDRKALASRLLVIRTVDPLALVASVQVLVSVHGKLTPIDARDRGDGSWEATYEGHGRLQMRTVAKNSYGITLASLGRPRALTVRLPAPETTPAGPTAAETAVARASGGEDGSSGDDASRTGDVVADESRTQSDPVGSVDAAPGGPSGLADTVAVADGSPGATSDTGEASDAKYGEASVSTSDLGEPIDPGEPAPSGAGLSNGPLGWGLAGGAAASLGGAIALGLSAKSKAKAFNGDPLAFASQTEALKTGRAARTQALGASLLYGGAALLAGGAAAAILMQGRDDAGAGEPDAAFALAPAEGGAVLLVAGTFR